MLRLGVRTLLSRNERVMDCLFMLLACSQSAHTQWGRCVHKHAPPCSRIYAHLWGKHAGAVLERSQCRQKKTVYRIITRACVCWSCAVLKSPVTGTTNMFGGGFDRMQHYRKWSCWQLCVELSARKTAWLHEWTLMNIDFSGNHTLLSYQWNTR